MNCATAAFCYLLQIKRNQGLSSDCTSPFHVAKCYIISCLFSEIKLWPLNWLILESKSCTEMFSSESVRFLFELTVVQSFVNTAVKWKKPLNTSLILPIWCDWLLQITWRFSEGTSSCDLTLCKIHRGKKIKNKKKWNDVKSKLMLQLEVFSAMAEIKYCQENKKNHSWTGCISAQATI